MKTPVQIVCSGCLQSLELVPDVHGRMPALCPACGRTLDSALSDLETPTSNYRPPGPEDTGDFIPFGRAPKPTTDGRWAENWERGSLGMIGRFQLRELLGQGGFGSVYKAYDPRLDRDVALKVLKPSANDDRARQRFFREARAVALLNHPNVVKVHDSGTDDGQCWVAYQLVEGRTLAKHLEAGKRADFLVTARVVRALADALGHAHRRNVTHRDLKPANVMMDVKGLPHVIDFGLASRADRDSDLTRDGAILGTERYMPPEQAAGKSRAADARSDIYSLGLIFYEMLCGRPAVVVAEAGPAWRKQQGALPTDFPPPRAVNREVPLALERICMRAVAHDPAQRYPTAKAFRDDLDRWIKLQQKGWSFRFPSRAVMTSLAAVSLLGLGMAAMSVLVSGPDAADATAQTLVMPLPEPPGGLGDTFQPRPLEAPPAASPDASTLVHVLKKGVYHTSPDCYVVRDRGARMTTMTLAEALKVDKDRLECKNCQKLREDH